MKTQITYNSDLSHKLFSISCSQVIWIFQLYALHATFSHSRLQFQISDYHSTFT